MAKPAGKDKIRQLLTSRAMRAAAIAVICALLGAGAFYGWRYYQFRQSSQFAFERLRDALSPAQPEKLASMIDFNTVARELADGAIKAFPFFRAGLDQEWEIRQMIQSGLLRSFRSKDAGAAKNQEAGMEKQLDLPFALLPHNFNSQLAQTLSLRKENDHSAYISATIRQTMLDRDFSPVFHLQKGADGWRVTHLLNGDELAASLRDGLVARQAMRQKKIIDKNSATSAQMEALLPGPGCQASAGMLSDGRTMLVAIDVRSRNAGNVQVNNMTLDITLSGRGGVVLSRSLNVAKSVPPGAAFSHRWNVELDAAENQEGKRLLFAGPLSCKASWRSMGLGNSRVLHVTDNPDAEAMCARHDDSHADGLCELPFFNE